MRRLVVCIAPVLFLLPACRGGLAPDSDKATGESALRTALEAWKSGKSQEDLAQQDPSIIMNEDDWRLGKRLIEFKMEEAALSGRQVRCRVQIKLQDKEKTEDRSAVYIIDTIPRIVIVRDSFAS